MSSEATPVLWSDFDGTAVEKLSKKNPLHWRRNMLKTKLAGIPGYSDFVGGVIESGIGFAGFVTIRKEEVRKSATETSVRTLGYDALLGCEAKVIYAGREDAKGQFVVDQSKNDIIGMIDDNPHKIGKAMLDAILESKPGQDATPRQPIVLGAVRHPSSHDRMRRLHSYAESLPNVYVINHDIGIAGEAPGFTVSTPAQSLSVVQLAAYSHESGIAFGGWLQTALI